eukprot:m51a1_g4078 hypothetical protein (841) ;mRNA; r:2976-9615
MQMKVSVSVGEAKFLVPCGDGQKPVGWLLAEVEKRATAKLGVAPGIKEIQTTNGETLDVGDNLTDLVEDGAFLVAVADIRGSAPQVPAEWRFDTRNTKAILDSIKYLRANSESILPKDVTLRAPTDPPANLEDRAVGVKFRGREDSLARCIRQLSRLHREPPPGIAGTSAERDWNGQIAVFGAPGCGKTRFVEELAELFSRGRDAEGMKRIEELCLKGAPAASSEADAAAAATSEADAADAKALVQDFASSCVPLVVTFNRFTSQKTTGLDSFDSSTSLSWRLLISYLFVIGSEEQVALMLHLFPSTPIRCTHVMEAILADSGCRNALVTVDEILRVLEVRGAGFAYDMCHQLGVLQSYFRHRVLVVVTTLDLVITTDKLVTPSSNRPLLVIYMSTLTRDDLIDSLADHEAAVFRGSANYKIAAGDCGNTPRLFEKLVVGARQLGGGALRSDATYDELLQKMIDSLRESSQVRGVTLALLPPVVCAKAVALGARPSSLSSKTAAELIAIGTYENSAALGALSTGDATVCPHVSLFRLYAYVVGPGNAHQEPAFPPVDSLDPAIAEGQRNTSEERRVKGLLHYGLAPQTRGATWDNGTPFENLVLAREALRPMLLHYVGAGTATAEIAMSLYDYLLCGTSGVLFNAATRDMLHRTVVRVAPDVAFYNCPRSTYATLSAANSPAANTMVRCCHPNPGFEGALHLQEQAAGGSLVTVGFECRYSKPESGTYLRVRSTAEEPKPTPVKKIEAALGTVPPQNRDNFVLVLVSAQKVALNFRGEELPDKVVLVTKDAEKQVTHLNECIAKWMMKTQRLGEEMQRVLKGISSGVYKPKSELLQESKT